MGEKKEKKTVVKKGGPENLLGGGIKRLQLEGKNRSPSRRGEERNLTLCGGKMVSSGRESSWKKIPPQKRPPLRVSNYRKGVSVDGGSSNVGPR